MELPPPNRASSRHRLGSGPVAPFLCGGGFAADVEPEAHRDAAALVGSATCSRGWSCSTISAWGSPRVRLRSAPSLTASVTASTATASSTPARAQNAQPIARDPTSPARSAGFAPNAP